jgi:hypothetical protein
LQPDSEIKLCELLTDTDNDLTITAMCEQAGISRPTYYSLLENPNFQALLQKCRDKQSASDAVEIDRALKKKAIAGNVMAIRTFYERRAELKTDKINIPSSIAITWPRPDIPQVSTPPVEKSE